MTTTIRRIQAPAGYGDSVRKLFSPGTRLIKHDVLRSIQQVQNALNVAEQDADKIRTDAISEREKNIAAWKNEALETARSEVVATQIQAQNKYDNAVAQAEQDLVQLAVQIAERVVGDALAIQPEAVAVLVAQHLSNLRGATVATVTIHPEDAAHVAHEREALSRIAGARVTFETNTDILRGGCVIETDLGRIDGRLETQLANIRKSLEQS